MSEKTPFLEGVKILDFTQYLAGPSATRMLAEMGADVIKVELAPYGDPVRSQPPRKNRRAGYFVQQNRGKRSICFDISKKESYDLMLQLVAEVDVVIENYSPGVMARRGLDYESLKKVNPGIIMASISGFGQTGSFSHKTSFDLIAQGFSGMMHVTGEPDGPPQFVGAAIGDCTAGLHAFAALGYALHHKAITGRGTHIDLAMIDCMFHMHETNVYAYAMTDGEYEPMRTGRHHPVVAPGGTYKGPEGWIVLLVAQRQMDGLWTAIGRPELAQDPRFAKNGDRLDNIDEFVAIVEEWMATFDTDDEVIEVLEQHRVPCARVMSPADAIDHPYYRERRMVREVQDPLIGELTVPGFPFRFSDAPEEPDLVTPALGEHNEEVLRELLDLGDADIQRLNDSGILMQKDR